MASPDNTTMFSRKRNSVNEKEIRKGEVWCELLLGHKFYFLRLHFICCHFLSESRTLTNIIFLLPYTHSNECLLIQLHCQLQCILFRIFSISSFPSYKFTFSSFTSSVNKNLMLLRRDKKKKRNYAKERERGEE